jgi:ABC-2 type transport system ATP-binding protein
MKGSLLGLFSRQRNEIHAVKDITLSIQQGELVGFLGPNGAGKTTTLKMLTGILNPTSGSCNVLGHVPFDRRPEMLRQIAFVVGNKQQLWWDLPAWDSYLVLKELYEIPDQQFKSRSDALIDLLQLTDKINTQVRKLSLGERMKCELVAALLHRPKVVFLDEPTLGLDVVSQKRIRQFLLETQKEDGSTIILTSHYMQDVEAICNRVIVIDRGAQVFDGTLEFLSKQYADSRRLKLTFASEIERADVEKFGKLVEFDDGQAILEVPRSEIAPITSSVLQQLPVIDIAIEEIPIEDVIADLFSSTK